MLKAIAVPDQTANHRYGPSQAAGHGPGDAEATVAYGGLTGAIYAGRRSTMWQLQSPNGLHSC